jgi:hypothetical protein
MYRIYFDSVKNHLSVEQQEHATKTTLSVRKLFFNIEGD